jgi:hypothetical protein
VSKERRQLVKITHKGSDHPSDLAIYPNTEDVSVPRSLPATSKEKESAIMEAVHSALREAASYADNASANSSDLHRVSKKKL